MRLAEAAQKAPLGRDWDREWVGGDTQVCCNAGGWDIVALAAKQMRGRGSQIMLRPHECCVWGTRVTQTLH